MFSRDDSHEVLLPYSFNTVTPRTNTMRRPLRSYLSSKRG